MCTAAEHRDQPSCRRAQTRSPVSRPTDPSVPLPPSKSRTMYTARVYGKVRKTAKASWLNLQQASTVTFHRWPALSGHQTQHAFNVHVNFAHHIAAIWVLSREEETLSVHGSLGSRSLVLTQVAIDRLGSPALSQLHPVTAPLRPRTRRELPCAPAIPTLMPAFVPPWGRAGRSLIT